MPGDTSVFAMVLITAVVTLVLAIKYPGLVRDRFVEPIESARTLFGLVIGVLAVWYALQSGVVWMMALALIGVAFVTAFVYYEEPHKEIR